MFLLLLLTSEYVHAFISNESKSLNTHHGSDVLSKHDPLSCHLSRQQDETHFARYSVKGFAILVMLHTACAMHNADASYVFDVLSKKEWSVSPRSLR